MTSTSSPLHLNAVADSAAGGWAGGHADAAPGSDEALVARAGAGDTAAFERLVGRYRDRIYQFVLWQPGVDDTLADDITQEVFLQLYRATAQFRGRSRFRTWLYSLARNVCRNQLRRYRRLGCGRAAAEPESVLAGLADQRPGPLARCERSEAAERVARAVDELPEPFRSALLLREWEEMSYAEIAAVLGVPVGTVRSRLHKARARLALQLTGEAP